MKQELKTKLHQPRLDTVLMIEETIKKYSGEFRKFQLWRKLPRAVMYQTFQVVLDYLEYCPFSEGTEKTKIIATKEYGEKVVIYGQDTKYTL